MLVLLIIGIILFAVWVMYGRGAYIVYKYQKDEGVLLPENTDKEQAMDAIKNNLGYKDTKEIFFDEDGEICIAGKYDTYVVNLKNGRVYMDDPLYSDISEYGNRAFSFLQKLGRFRIRARRKKDRARVEELLCIRAYIAKVFDHNAPVNAHKKYSDMIRAKKYSGIVLAVCVVLVTILFVFALSNGMEDQTIDSIKYANLESYSTDVRIGEAFDDFFVNPTWETYSIGEKEYVKFSGEFLYYGDKYLAVVTFEFLELDWFKVSNIAINGTNLNEWEIDELLTEIFYSYEK